jgi:hypothetical protein
MHETKRHYIDWKERKFLIIFFADEDREQVKIFLHRQLIYQQFILAADDQRNDTITVCRKWIEANYPV